MLIIFSLIRYFYWLIGFIGFVIWVGFFLLVCLLSNELILLKSNLIVIIVNKNVKLWWFLLYKI